MVLLQLFDAMNPTNRACATSLFHYSGCEMDCLPRIISLAFYKVPGTKNLLSIIFQIMFIYLESLELRREPPRKLASLLKDEPKGEDGICNVELGIGIELVGCGRQTVLIMPPR